MKRTLNNYLPHIQILKNEPLSKYTFTKTGGEADYLAFPKNLSELKELVKSAQKAELPITTIGNASNLIIRDGGIKGLTIILTRMKSIIYRDNQIVADSGAALIDASIAARNHSLTGLEFASGIPGSIGGAIFMNAGAYGGSTSKVVDSIKVIDRDGKILTLTNNQLNFSYRHSIVQDNEYIVISVKFALEVGDKDLIQSKMDHLNALRSSKQPLDYPSCGSVFKRPAGHFAGKLIHDAGLQGYQSGGAKVSLKHAGFIINVNNATATDYLNVIHHIQHLVYKKYNVELKTEVRIIGKSN